MKKDKFFGTKFKILGFLAMFMLFVAGAASSSAAPGDPLTITVESNVPISSSSYYPEETQFTYTITSVMGNSPLCDDIIGTVFQMGINESQSITFPTVTTGSPTCHPLFDFDVTPRNSTYFEWPYLWPAGVPLDVSSDPATNTDTYAPPLRIHQRSTVPLVVIRKSIAGEVPPEADTSRFDFDVTSDCFTGGPKSETIFMNGDTGIGDIGYSSTNTDCEFTIEEVDLDPCWVPTYESEWYLENSIPFYLIYATNTWGCNPPEVPVPNVEKLVFDAPSGSYINSDAAPGGLYAAGDVVIWQIIVSNPGTIPFEAIVSDPFSPGCSVNIGVLDPGAVEVFSCAHDSLPGLFENTVIVEAVTEEGSVTVSDTEWYTAVQSSSLALKKDVTNDNSGTNGPNDFTLEAVPGDSAGG